MAFAMTPQCVFGLAPGLGLGRYNEIVEAEVMVAEEEARAAEDPSFNVTAVLLSPQHPTRLTPATLISSTELRCMSPSDRYGLDSHLILAKNPPAPPALLLGSSDSNATVPPPPPPPPSWLTTMSFVRFGITINGADITLPSGEAPPLLPPELHHAPSPPSPTSPPSPPPTGGGKRGWKR